MRLASLCRTGAGAAAALLLASLATSSDAGTSSGNTWNAAANNTCYDFTRAEKAFKNKINRVRSNKGLVKLRLDPELSKAAKVHTREMIRKDTLYHTSDALFAKRVTNWAMLGENVGVGGGVTSLHKAFMNSPAHKANVILPAFRHVGVGVIKKGAKMWVTIQFESEKNPGTTLKMPSC